MLGQQHNERQYSRLQRAQRQGVRIKFGTQRFYTFDKNPAPSE